MRTSTFMYGLPRPGWTGWWWGSQQACRPPLGSGSIPSQAIGTP
ncbi:MAG: hypothetical protein ACKOPS_09945 [Cyanobium sp.]